MNILNIFNNLVTYKALQKAGNEKDSKTQHNTNQRIASNDTTVGRIAGKTGYGPEPSDEMQPESEAVRKGSGTDTKKGNPESGQNVRHPQFPHQPKTTNLNEP